jgi:phosphoserine phosphatase RsbU/P
VSDLTGREPLDYGAEPVRRFLVVDDDRLTNRLLQVRLGSMDYEVLSAGSGEDALKIFEREAVDLLFVDVSMPGIGGLEVLERVRSTGRDVAVIMMTAYGTEEVAVEALRRGADDYLRKPFEGMEFEAVVERTVARLRLGRQNAALRSQLDEKRRQLETELSRAARVQADLLPQGTPKVEGFEVAARCVPAREIGGDFYDWSIGPSGRLGVTLGDVMGKGMPAALLMATVRAVMQALSAQSSPAEAVNLASHALGNDLQRSASFVTLFHAQLDPGPAAASPGRLLYVDAGHGHAFVRRSSGASGNPSQGTAERLEAGGVPLGALPDLRYDGGSVDLDVGDALVVYSDGLVESRPNRPLGTGALSYALRGARTAAEMVERLIGLAGLSGPPHDDLTVMVLLRNG